MLTSSLGDKGREEEQFETSTPRTRRGYIREVFITPAFHIDINDCGKPERGSIYT